MDNLNGTVSDIGSAMQGFEVSIANSLSAISNLTNSKAVIEETPLDTKINDLNSNTIQFEAAFITQAHKTEQLQKSVSTLLA